MIRFLRASRLAAMALALLLPAAALAQTLPPSSVQMSDGSYRNGGVTSLCFPDPSTGVCRVVRPPDPLPVTVGSGPSTNASGTVTTGNTYQTVFAANAARKGCLIQNPTTASEILSVRQAGAAVWTLQIGGTFSCGSAVVATDLIEATAATTGHAFTAVSQ